MLHTQRLRQGTFAALILLPLLFVLSRYYPLGIDWSFTYHQAAENWRDPFVIHTFTNPPWVLVLVPHAWLPVQWGNAINLLLNVTLLMIIIRRYRGGWQTMLLVFTSAPFFDLMRTNNVDWIPLLALLLPPMWGLPVLVIKPHSLGAIALIWWKRERFGVRMLLPTIVIGLVSLAIWGLWPLQGGLPENVSWNFAPFPFFVPVGVYMLYRAYQDDNEVLAAASTPLLTPYIAPYSVTAVLALAGSRYRREAFIVWAAFWVYFIIQARTLDF